MVRLEIKVTTEEDGRTVITSHIQGKKASVAEYALFFAKSRREFEGALNEMIDTVYTSEDSGWQEGSLDTGFATNPVRDRDGR